MLIAISATPRCVRRAGLKQQRPPVASLLHAATSGRVRVSPDGVPRRPDGNMLNVLMAAVVVGFGKCQSFRRRRGRPYELVSHVAYCTDHLLVLGAELGAQSPDVDIDGAGTAEEVMAPYFF
jgi:hypothetical protein